MERLDVEALCAPLPPGGSGVDLRGGEDGGVFYRLKDLRAEARAAERDAAAFPSGEAPVLESGLGAWTQLSVTAALYLATRTKDLELASWLCEAQVRGAGLEGLADGLEVCRRLLEAFWDEGLLPPEDEDGPVSRVTPIAGLLGLEGGASLLQAIRLTPLSDHAPSLALWTVETAHAPPPASEDVGARDRARVRQEEQLEAVKQGLVLSSTAFLRATYRAACLCADRAETLAQAADERAAVGRFGSQVVQPLRAIAALYEAHVGQRLLDVHPVQEEGRELQGSDAASPLERAAPLRPTDRAQAYEAILRIADFFAEAEPQSMVSRSLREVVRRAKLPLDDLLSELLPDAAQRTLFLQRAGVRDESATDTNNGYG